MSGSDEGYWNAPEVSARVGSVELASFIYRLYDNGVDILRYGLGGTSEDFPYEDYPEFFPGARAWLSPISREVQQFIRRLNAGDTPSEGEWQGFEQYDVPHHQIMGEPRLVQDWPVPPLECPICSRQLDFLAEIADDCLDPRGFTGNEFVQVLFWACPGCRLLAAYNQCD